MRSKYAHSKWKCQTSDGKINCGSKALWSMIILKTQEFWLPSLSIPEMKFISWFEDVGYSSCWQYRSVVVWTRSGIAFILEGLTQLSTLSSPLKSTSKIFLPALKLAYLIDPFSLASPLLKPFNLSITGMAYFFHCNQVACSIRMVSYCHDDPSNE